MTYLMSERVWDADEFLLHNVIKIISIVVFVTLCVVFEICL